MPSSYNDIELEEYATRVSSDTVVVITGGGAGIGRATALKFAKFGATIVIGDLDQAGADKTAAEVIALGGKCSTLRTDVLSWDDQNALFDHAYKKYGHINIVVANAGVTELGHFDQYTLGVNGLPDKPLLKTLDINVTGVIYTAHLGIYYLRKVAEANAIKSIVFLGSMASWQAIPRGPMYSASKHAVLGFARSLDLSVRHEGIRIAVIHPFFAPTAIVPLPVKIALAGIPKTSVERIAGAIFRSSTDPDLSTSGCPWLLPDHGDVFRLDREEMKEGVYHLINQRTKRAIAGVQGVRMWIATVKDLFHLLGRPVLLIVAAAFLANYGYQTFKSKL